MEVFNLTNLTTPENNSVDLNIPNYIIVSSAFFYILVFIIGCFGNLLVIFVVIRNKNLQYNTNYCLINLSIADLLLICICMPSTFIDLFSEEIWYLGYTLCKSVSIDY